MSHRRSSSGDYKVYIGNLPRDASEREIEKIFREFGRLTSVWVARNPPGFAFVEFEDERDAADAISELDETTICGAKVRVRNGNDYTRLQSRGPPRGASSRRPFDPSDKCYRCNQRGHYAYDCDKYNSGPRRPRSYSRSRSRDRRRSYSRSYSKSRSRERKRSRDRKRSRSKDDRKRSRSRSKDDRKSSHGRSKNDRKRSRSKDGGKQSRSRSRERRRSRS